jgi:hypothetical protein
VRGQLGDPKLDVHHGLPVTMIVSTTLKELTAGAGHGVTASGTLLPMRDVIRMASHAYHYLTIFDEHLSRPLYLGRSRRIATPDQRMVLYARDRGCTRPGCDTPGYWSEVHHVDSWARGGPTDVDNLTLACKPDNDLAEKGWQTRNLTNGPPNGSRHHDSTAANHGPPKNLLRFREGYHHVNRPILCLRRRQRRPKPLCLHTSHDHPVRGPARY